MLTLDQGNFSISTKILISSGMASAGWVSFSWMATWMGKRHQLEDDQGHRAQPRCLHVSLGAWYKCPAPIKQACAMPTQRFQPWESGVSLRGNVGPADPWCPHAEHSPDLERHRTRFLHCWRSQTWRLWNVGWYPAGLQPPQSIPASVLAPSLQKTSSQRDRMKVVHGGAVAKMWRVSPA